VPQHRNNPDYQRNRYAGVPLEELNHRIAAFGRCLARFDALRARAVAEHIYEIGT